MNFTKLAGIRQRRYGSHARDVVRECFSESTRTVFHAESADIPSLRSKNGYASATFIPLIEAIDPQTCRVCIQLQGGYYEIFPGRTGELSKPSLP
jgi:hypothetical protein